MSKSNLKSFDGLLIGFTLLIFVFFIFSFGQDHKSEVKENIAENVSVSCLNPFFDDGYWFCNIDDLEVLNESSYPS